jgi:6-phosphofructokinase 1
VLAEMISKIGLKNHWAVADYLQRSARHLASKTDLTQAYEVGVQAVKLALKGETGVMPIIKRLKDSPYKWTTSMVSLKNVANIEKTMPKKFITKDGFKITQAGRKYLSPLIRGEADTVYVNGLPDIAILKNIKVKKKLNKVTF